jgi:hypothetical protein
MVLLLVLDGVCMVMADLLKESLEVIYLRLHVLLDAASDSRVALHVRAVHLFVIIIVAASYGSDPPRMLTLPLLATLDVLQGALDNDARWCHLTAIGGHFHVT